MSIDKNQFIEHLLEPVLKNAGLYSEAAVCLLLGTAAQESAFGTYIIQKPNGPALGLYQMEPKTHHDIYDNYLKYNNSLKARIFNICNFVVEPSKDELMYNLRYATLMCRLHYYRIPEKLPEPHNAENLAKYWKKYYNTEKGKGTIEEFISNYRKYVL